MQQFLSFLQMPGRGVDRSELKPSPPGRVMGILQLSTCVSRMGEHCEVDWEGRRRQGFCHGLPALGPVHGSGGDTLGTERWTELATVLGGQTADKGFYRRGSRHSHREGCTLHELPESGLVSVFGFPQPCPTWFLDPGHLETGVNGRCTQSMGQCTPALAPQTCQWPYPCS